MVEEAFLRGRGNYSVFQAHEVLRAATAYHTCPWVRISLRRPVYFPRAIGTLLWLRTGGARRRVTTTTIRTRGMTTAKPRPPLAQVKPKPIRRCRCATSSYFRT